MHTLYIYIFNSDTQNKEYSSVKINMGINYRNMDNIYGSPITGKSLRTEDYISIHKLFIIKTIVFISETILIKATQHFFFVSYAYGNPWIK